MSDFGIGHGPIARAVLLAACLSVFAGQAIAQEGAAQEAEPEAAPKAVEQTTQEETTRDAPAGIDEIVVTAQHRKQVLKDVPISMSVIGGDEIRDAGIISMDDVARRVPNVQIQGNRDSVFIRGFGSASNALVESSVGLTIDGITYGRVGYIREGFLDISRFEVLRGPQGTLYGKNAVAGVINIITGDPEHEAGAKAKFAMGDYDQKQIDAAVWGELFSPKLMGRLTVSQHELGNYIENTTTDKQIGETKTRGIRGKLLFEVTPTINVLASLQYSDQYTNGPQGELITLSPEAELVYRPFDPDTDTNLDYHVQRDEDAERSRDSYTGYFKADVELGDWVLTSLSGFTTSNDFYNLDGDFSGAPNVTLQLDEEYNQYSQEFRIISPPGRFEFIAGLYLFHATLEGGNDTKAFNYDEGGSEIVNVILPSILQSIYNFDSPLSPTQAERTTAVFEQSTTAYAIYGQASYEVLDWVKVEAGLRLNYETKDIDYYRTLSQPSVIFTAGGVEEFQYIDDRTERDISPKLSVIADVTEQQSVYLTLARGYKAGGFSAAAVNPDEITFEPEKSDTIEFGTKGSAFGGALRANFSLFYMMFDDLQVSNYNGSSFVISNAASATAYGLEADFMLFPASWLILNGAAGYNHATYDEYKNAVCPSTQLTQNDIFTGGNPDSCDISGKRLAKAPRWNISLGARISLPIDQIKADLVFTPSWTWQSKIYLDTDLDPIDAQEAYGLLGLNLALSDQDGMWTASINVSNATDEVYKYASVDVPVFAGTHAAFIGQPRLVLGAFEIRF
ncbi:MAG: TonB-dependent receptor [Alphaproteobacteria bacterium]